MGKAKAADAAGDRPRSAASHESTLCLCRHAATVGKALSAKCVAALLLGVGVFLSALFLLLRLRASGVFPDDPGTLLGGIQASFILSKPPAQLASHVTMLEEEIYHQIGVPNTKVSVNMFSLKDATYVQFGILPDTTNASISAQSIKMLRKNLIGLTLQQRNLSLTPSVFGDPFCVEVLGFPGGITITMEIEHLLLNSTVDPTNIIFSVTLGMSIRQLRGLIGELKKSFGQLLGQDIYIDLTNKNGSTIAPPSTVQVFLSPNDTSICQDPQRLQQLAEIIIESNPRNLGLNASIFGRIEDLKLAPCLQGLMPSFAPSSSPTPAASPSMPTHSQPNTTNPCEQCLCFDWVTIQDAAVPHRKLMRIPSMGIPLRLPTQLRSWNVPRSKKNGNAPTFIAPSSRP